MTSEERETLLSRVYVVEPGIVFYREIPVQTVESIDLMLARMYELACEWPTFIEVLDLSTVSRPSPPYAPRSVFGCCASRRAWRIMCVIVEKNIVMRAVARFVGYSMNIRQVSFYETEAEAIDAATATTRLIRTASSLTILRHLAEIGAGRSSITDDDLAKAPTTSCGNCWWGC